MSVQPVPWPEPDPRVAAAIRAMYGSRKTGRPLAVEVRDRLGQWLADEDFAAAFGIRGRPGWSPSRLAVVTILQREDKLTDRLAAEAVRARLDWKFLLGCRWMIRGSTTRWREETWPVIKGRRRTWAPGSASKTSPARA